MQLDSLPTYCDKRILESLLQYSYYRRSSYWRQRISVKAFVFVVALRPYCSHTHTTISYIYTASNLTRKNTIINCDSKSSFCVCLFFG
jgi:hypothetical protein